MSAINEAIARRRQAEALYRIAAMAEDDKVDLEQAGNALGALSTTIKQGKAMLSQAQSLPGGSAVAQRIQPLVTALQTSQRQLLAPLQRFGQRSSIRRQTCNEAGWAKGRGAVTSAERARTVPTKTPVFARLHFKAGKLSTTFALTGVNDGFRLFNLGRGDQVGAYGYDGNPACTDFHTNLLEKGTLRPGAVFVGHGFAFAVETVDGSAVSRADLTIIGRGRVSWTEQNDKHKIEHPRIGVCPLANDIDEQSIAAGRTGARWVGETYVQDDPILRLRGEADGKPADRGHAMLLEWEDTSAELSTEVYLYCYLLGEHLQSPGGK